MVRKIRTSHWPLVSPMEIPGRVAVTYSQEERLQMEMVRWSVIIILKYIIIIINVSGIYSISFYIHVCTRIWALLHKDKYHKNMKKVINWKYCRTKQFGLTIQTYDMWINNRLIVHCTIQVYQSVNVLFTCLHNKNNHLILDWCKSDVFVFFWFSLLNMYVCKHTKKVKF